MPSRTSKKGEKEAVPSVESVVAGTHDEAVSQADEERPATAQAVIKDNKELYQLLRGGRRCEESRKNVDKNHDFWDTQPVPKHNETITEEEIGPIDPIKTPDDVRKEPYALPDAFEWCTCNVEDGEELQEIYTLLYENYVEDDDNMFRFDYSQDFLRWALTPPAFETSWHVGVRVKAKGVNGKKKLVGFITGIPARVKVGDQEIDMAEINFLCVHKKLRSKRLAPVLIKEVARRINSLNRWQAVYTAGVTLPRPVASCRYHHRSLNPKKLLDVNFSHLAHRMTISRTIKLYKLPDEPQTPGLREMRKEDVPEVTALLANYLKKFSLRPVFDEHEIGHWLLPRPDVVYSYVREDGGKVTDVVSFYCLPSTVIGNDKHKQLRAAYSFYNVATSVPLKDLMQDALILARNTNFDVFNALDLMENSTFLKELKFGEGDGHLQYYLYNWKYPQMQSGEVGLVLL